MATTDAGLRACPRFFSPSALRRTTNCRCSDVFSSCSSVSRNKRRQTTHRAPGAPFIAGPSVGPYLLAPSSQPRRMSVSDVVLAHSAASPGTRAGKFHARQLIDWRTKANGGREMDSDEYAHRLLAPAPSRRALNARYRAVMRCAEASGRAQKAGIRRLPIDRAPLLASSPLHARE